MQLADFEISVANYLARDPAFFGIGVQGQPNLLRQATNRARMQAQLRHPFELLRDLAELTLEPGVGGLIKDAVLKGTADPVHIRKIERASFEDSSGNFFPVDIVRRETYFNRMRRQTRERPLEEIAEGTYQTQLVVFQHGPKLFMAPWVEKQFNEEVKILLEVVRFAPELSADEDEDFFLVEGEPWTFLQAVLYGNLYLKDSERVAVSAGVLRHAWDSFLAWDNSIVHRTDDLDLS